MQRSAQLLIGLSILLLLFVTIDFFAIKDKNKETDRTEQKSNLVDKANEVGNVLGVGGCQDDPTFTFDESGNFSPSSVTAVYKYGSWDLNEDTNFYYVCINKPVSPSYSVTGVNWPASTSQNAFSVVGSYGSFMFKNSGTYTFYSSSNPSAIGTIYAGISSSNPPSSSPPSISTNTKKTTTSTSPETIKNVILPVGFGAGSTKLSEIPDPAKVENLTLDTSVGTIKFVEAVDLSSTDTKDKFKELDKYVKIEQAGVISLDSINLPVLNKKATLTMKGLSFVKTPRVLYNGKEDKTVVSNIKYKNGVLTFNVTKFSTFTAAPTVGIEEPDNNFEVKDKTIKLKGTVSDPTATVSAKLNNRDLGKLKVATNGAYEKEINLSEGENKIVVSALSKNLATASASVSGILKKAANLVLIYSLLVVLSVLAIGGGFYGYRKMRKAKFGVKTPIPSHPSEALPEQVQNEIPK